MYLYEFLFVYNDYSAFIKFFIMIFIDKKNMDRINSIQNFINL